MNWAQYYATKFFLCICFCTLLIFSFSFLYNHYTVLDLNKEDLINIKNIIDNDKKRGVIYNSILDVIDFQTYYGIMRKINSNMNNVLSVYLFSCKYFLKKYSKEPDTDGRVKFVFIFGNNTSDLVNIKHEN